MMYLSMDIRTSQKTLRNDLSALYDSREAATISDWVMEHITGLSRSQRLVRQHDPLLPVQLSEWHRCRDELLRWRPVQYVIGTSWFAGMRLFVDERVLIPRPETEELVDWIVREIEVRKVGMDNSGVTDAKGSSAEGVFRIADIGTGSGCIAIGLKRKCPHDELWGLDASAAALQLAAENGEANHAEIIFRQTDILDKASRDKLPVFDLIVSNPPYVLQDDRQEMRENVLRYEPHMALFVDGSDPLLFYREILRFADTHLRSGGMLFFEIHESMGEAMRSLLEGFSYREISVAKDITGRDRMVKAVKHL
jgi:release factor glutamine methyltransferase